MSAEQDPPGSCPCCGFGDKFENAMDRDLYARGLLDCDAYDKALYGTLKAGLEVAAAIETGSWVLSLARGGFRALMAARVAAKTGMTDLQLVTRAAQKAEAAIGGTGRFAGTAKHTYANNLLSRYQNIYGNRGLQFNQFFKGPAGRGFLDVVNHRTMTIYDYKFGSAVMGNSQFLKYSNSFSGYRIQIIRP